MALPLSNKIRHTKDSMTQRVADLTSKSIDTIVNALNGVFSFGTNVTTVTQAMTFNQLVTLSSSASGTRVLALRGYIGAPTLNTSGTYPASDYVPGTTAGFLQISHTCPFASSVAAIMCKVYGSTASTGTLTLTTSVTSTFTIAVTAAQANANYVQTFAPGTWPIAAGGTLGVNATSSGWTQGITNQTGIQLDLWMYT